MELNKEIIGLRRNISTGHLWGYGVDIYQELIIAFD